MITPDIAAAAEAAFQRHLAAVDLQPGRPVRRVPVPGPSSAMKRLIWAGAAQKKAEGGAGKPRKPSGASHLRHRFPALDYAAWARGLAEFCTVPRSFAEMVGWSGVTGVAFKRRLYRARTEGAWLPPGMRERRSFAAGGKVMLAVEAV